MWSISNTLLYLGLWHIEYTLGWKYPKQTNKCMQLSQVNLSKDSQITQQVIRDSFQLILLSTVIRINYNLPICEYKINYKWKVKKVKWIEKWWTVKRLNKTKNSDKTQWVKRKIENYLSEWQHPRQIRLECKRLPQGSRNVQELLSHLRRNSTKLKKRRSEDW